jgi:hypothetical protein
MRPASARPEVMQASSFSWTEAVDQANRGGMGQPERGTGHRTAMLPP